MADLNGTLQCLEFDGTSSREFGLFLTAPGIYDSPDADVESISIPGLNGDLIRDNARSGMRRYQNVDIKYKAFFVGGLSENTRGVKSWLLSPTGYRRLADTYDPDFYRMAVCTKAVSFDVTRRSAAAEMELVFNCKPQRWAVDGDTAVPLTSSGRSITNPYAFHSLPDIVVTGSGNGVLRVGNYEVEILSLSKDITLNCETQNAYYSDGTFCNDKIYSDDFPVLAPGESTITWSGGIKSISVTPRWWTL